MVLYINPSNDNNDASQIVDNALATVMHSSRCAVNHTMQTSPGALVFQRNMMMNIPLIVRTVIDQTGTEELTQILQNTLCACK